MKPVKPGLALGRVLRRINRLALGAALGIVALLVIASSFSLGLWALVDASRIQARVLSDNAVAALAFGDVKAAAELLQSMRNSPDVQMAAIYGADERLFASHRQGDSEVPARRDAAIGDLLLQPSFLVVSQAVTSAAGATGHLLLKVSLASLYRQTLWQVAAMALAAGLALLASGVLLRRLNASVLRPLDDLNELMAQVSDEGDYSVRAGPSRITELHALGLGFNTMLEQIHERDERLAAHRDHLEDEVNLRTAQLRLARDAAAAASRAKSEFLATMSHEIRTPMNGVLGMNELLMGTELEPQQRQWAAGVQTSGRHLLAVINDILDFSKIESGHLALEAVDFDLRQVIDDGLLMFLQPAAAKGLTLSARFIPSGVASDLRGDPFRLRQVIANLINNAIKFTPQGQVTVQVELHDHDAQHSQVTIRVQDTGIGIALQAQQTIFEHFAQADGSTTRQHGGTGLGLAICRRLLDLMGGRIRVESSPGAGATFVVELHLPKAQAVQAAPAPPAHAQRPAAPAAMANADVLLVEDNAINQSVATALLRRLGLTVWLANNGQEAVERVRAQAFDLVLMDCQMPVMDGFEATRAIRAWERDHPLVAALPIIALTANAMSGDRQACLAAGMSDYLAKPIVSDRLAEVVARHLRTRAADHRSAAPEPVGPDDLARSERGIEAAAT